MRLSFFCGLATGLLILVWPASTPPVLAAAGAALAGIRPSVVFIALQAENEVGSGVVVRTSQDGTFIVTAAHVASAGSDIDIYFEDDLTHPHRAKVIKLDKDLDLALLRVDGLAPAQASLSDGSTPGTGIAVLGYPAARTERMINKDGRAEPTAALGTVTSVRDEGATILTNAVTEPGDSGAPIFEQENAEIVGIVTGQIGSSKQLGFRATGVVVLRAFLKSAGIEVVGARGGYGAAKSDTATYQPIIGRPPLPQGPGARRLLVNIFEPGLGLHNDSSGTIASVSKMQTFIYGDLQTVLSDAVSDAFDAHISDAHDTLRAVMTISDEVRTLYQRNYIAGLDLEVYAGLKSTTVLQSTLNVDVYVKVMDRFGETHFQGHGHGTIGRLLGDPGESEVERVVASSTKDAVEDTRLQMARMGGGDDAAKNFARYGIPVASGRKSALFLVKADPKGARVSDILFYGTAARGQLQKNDLIVQLDGEELAKHSPDEILALFEHHKGAVYHCTVLEPDGQTVVISFEPQDIRWYQENAPGTGRRR